MFAVVIIYFIQIYAYEVDTELKSSYLLEHSLPDFMGQSSQWETEAVDFQGRESRDLRLSLYYLCLLVLDKGIRDGI